MNCKLPALCAVLLLAACAGKQPDASAGNAPAQFTCNNGAVVAAQFTQPDVLSLTYGEENARLQLAVSASGERYFQEKGLFGKPTEWHQKRNEAVFVFTNTDGVKTETFCTVR